MGSTSSFIMGSTTVRKPSELFDVADDNGYILQNHYIPEEILSIILSYVPPKDLVFLCRLVCKNWCNIIDSQVWRLKLGKNKALIQKIHDIPWFACYWISTKDTIDRNLIKNGCGQDKLKHWTIIKNGGDRWLVEKPPVGCDEFPQDCNEEMAQFQSCFVTSFAPGIKEQIIDLQAEGAVPEFMDVIHPMITVSDWYAGRFDCLAVYQLHVSLLDENHDALDDYDIKNNVGSADGTAWNKVSHTFSNYGPGVRFIRFVRFGSDKQFWKGHYGSKMTGASVRLTLPDSVTTLQPVNLDLI